MFRSQEVKMNQILKPESVSAVLAVNMKIIILVRRSSSTPSAKVPINFFLQ